MASRLRLRRPDRAPAVPTPPRDKPNIEKVHFLPFLCTDKTISGYWIFTISEWFTIFLTLILSALLRFPKLSHPSYNLFDETHFGGFVSDYIRGICFFDIHPPLGKLILYGTARLIRYDGSYNFSKHGARYTSDFYVPLRATPALFSTLIAPLLTGALILNRVPLSAAFLGGFLLTTDFTAITQCRLILTDGFLYFFVALTIFLVAVFERRPSIVTLLLQAIAAGCALSVKFTGACVLELIAVSHLKMLFGRRKWFLRLVLRGVVVASVCTLLLFWLVSVHLSLMPKKGFGDQYMSPNFRTLPRWLQILLLLKAMYTYNSRLGFSHPYQSKWWQWPIWVASPTLVDSMPVGWDRIRIMCIFNNPVAAFGSLAGAICGMIVGEWQYALGYIAAYGPLALVGRCMWTYHYEIPLMFGVLALCQVIGKLNTGPRRAIALFIGISALVELALWAPWVYDIPMQRKWHRNFVLWEKLKGVA
jgi:dolichyl-phosphate-mannose--protein O-mannosyl transferase